MRLLRLLSAPLAAAALLAAPPASAVGRVLSADGSAHVTELRVAIGQAPGRRVVWSALRIEGTAGPVAVVLPVTPGAFVDPAGDAWLGALEVATAPRVVPPGAPPPACANAARVDDTAEPEPTTRLEPSEVAELGSTDALAKWAASHALVLGSADAARLGEAGAPFIAVEYDLPDGGGTTSALRVVEPGNGPLPLALAADANHVVPAVVFAIAGAGARATPGTEIGTDAIDPLWAWHDGTSDYRQRSASALASASPGTWLVEARGADPLWSYSVLPGQAGSIAPAVDAYFKRAAPADANQCIGAANAAKKLAWTVATACADGALLRVPDANGVDPSCTEAPAAGQIDPGTLRCDGAPDLALALSGLDPASAAVTRVRTLVRADDPGVAFDTPAESASAVVTATRVDLHGCGSAPVQGTGGSSGTGSDPGGSGGGTGAPQGGGYDPSAGQPEPTQDGSTNVNVSTGCSGDSSSGSCSGDSSSSSSGDSSTCSGDSSSSSSGDGSTCSGDSSSSSGDGSTCSGDSSSSSGDGSTCSGDSSGGGDSCSGGSGDSSCSLSPRRVRPRASVLMLALMGVAFPVRRFGRRRRPT